jgi:hypothetical protein
MFKVTFEKMVEAFFPKLKGVPASFLNLKMRGIQPNVGRWRNAFLGSASGNDFRLVLFCCHLLTVGVREVKSASFLFFTPSGSRNSQTQNRICAKQVRVKQICAKQVYANWICAKQIFIKRICEKQICSKQICAKQICTKQICTKQIFTNWICAKQICAKQICPKQICVKEICANRICAKQIFTNRI